MIEINLLPKELRRKRGLFALRKNTAYLFGAGGILIILLIFITILQGIKAQSLNRRLAEAQRRKEELKESIKLVDALGELKNKILQRLSAIETLDRDRSTWIDIMEDLSSRVPDYLWLTGFKENPPVTPKASNVQTSQAGEETDTLKTTQAQAMPTLHKTVTIDGYAFSLNSLATFMINLMRSKYFNNIELGYIKLAELEKQKAYSFQLTSELFYASQVVSKGEAGTAETKLSNP
jgi:Tfp pilus assembly protein PilN